MQAFIRGTLSSQKVTFTRILRSGEPKVRALLDASAHDPLGALIAWSRLDTNLAVGLEPVDAAGTRGSGGLRGFRWPWMRSAPGVERAPATPQLHLCPELSLELRRQWAQSSTEERRPAPEAAGSLPAATGASAPGPAGTGGSSSGSTPAQRLSSNRGLQPSKPQSGPTSGPSKGAGGQDSPELRRSSQ